MSLLHSPFTLRGLTLRNRIVVAPMCQYSAEEGFANDWHLVHLGGFAKGGAGLVITEATAVEPRGRISPQDLGLWDDAQIESLRRITTFLRGQGAAAGIQLAHAGRKASTFRPWSGSGAVPAAQGGWQVVGPDTQAFADNYPQPVGLDARGIQEVIAAFVAAAKRALDAGFQVAEVHAAHGYLLHQFLSPLSNHRTDEYGGSFENRTRLVRQVVAAVRKVWPQELPLFVRLSATDWAEGGWTVDETVELSRRLKTDGADLIDTSSGGNVATAKVPAGPGYQTPFAARIRAEAKLPTGAVGLITSAIQAEHILRNEQADVVLLARELLRDPHWPLRSARELGDPGAWPNPYLRAR